MWNLVSTGKKERLSVSKGSEIEASHRSRFRFHPDVWYSAILEEDVPRVRRKRLCVRHLGPLDKEICSLSLIKKAFFKNIRPVPPQDPSPDSEFAIGDEIDAVHNNAWQVGLIFQVLGNGRYKVYFDYSVIEVDRRNLRPHWVWKDEEWFRPDNINKLDFSGRTVIEVITEVENLGDVWASAVITKGNKDDDTIMVRYDTLNMKDQEEMSVHINKIRPPPPEFKLKDYKLMENVDVQVNWRWCQGVVTEIQTGNRYTVRFGRNNESNEFDYYKLRPCMEWKNGVWQIKLETTEEKESVNKRKREAGQSVSGTSCALMDLDVLDCPVCFDALTIPILQCENGHVSCSTCCQKLMKTCATCSLPMLSRNRAMEKILEILKVPCPNAEFGCFDNITSNERSVHLKKCAFTQLLCPFSGCNFTALYGDLQEHIAARHCKESHMFDFGETVFLSAHPSNGERIILKERTAEGRGELVVVESFVTPQDRILFASCIGPGTEDFSYELLLSSSSDDSNQLIFRSKLERVSEVSNEPPKKYFMSVPSYVMCSKDYKFSIRIDRSSSA